MSHYDMIYDMGNQHGSINIIAMLLYQVYGYMCQEIIRVVTASYRAIRLWYGDPHNLM